MGPIVACTIQFNKINYEPSYFVSSICIAESKSAVHTLVRVGGKVVKLFDEMWLLLSMVMRHSRTRIINGVNGIH